MRTLTLLIAALSLIACHKHKKEVKSSTPQATAQPAPSQNQDSAGELDTSPVTTNEPASMPADLPAPAVPTSSDFDPIFFAFDEASLSDDAMDSLNLVGTYLSNHPEAGVVIAGHTDERGTEEYNMALADERARVAKTYLTRLGIDPSRIVIVAYGEEVPMSLGTGEETWAKNRRDEFKIVKKDEAQASNLRQQDQAQE